MRGIKEREKGCGRVQRTKELGWLASQSAALSWSVREHHIPDRERFDSADLIG